ncbi:hypothetical protein BFG51_04155 [Dietzia alimentaria]|nr:hypothetical protein BFG51_04155 [Dietzia alimentaria]
MSFESLIYTDCLSTESVHGDSGFAFQAVSPGAGTEIQNKVQNNVLYRVPGALRAVGTPVEDYPPSFAYWSDETDYLLAVGRYMGKESGGRDGNQLTHALATSSAADILPALPAQLYDAGVWLAEKAPSTRLDPIPAPLLVSERFMPVGLREMALEARDAHDFLATLLTALEKILRDPDSRLLIAADDAVTAARWIALGTLFFDREVALEFTFRIFTENPYKGSHRIMVFNPETVEKAVDIARLPDVHSGIDLRNFAASPMEISASARTYATWFLEGNAYDALDAIEFGRAWEPHVSDSSVSAAIASAAVMGNHDTEDFTTEDLAALVRGLARTEDGVEDYGDELIALFDRSPEDADAGVHHAATFAALADAGENVLAEQLASTSARRAEADPDGFGVVWASALAENEPFGHWSTGAARESTLLAVRRARGKASGESLGALMGVDSALGLETDWEAYRDDADRLAAYWATEPSTGDRLDSWLYRDRLVDLVRDHLEVQLAGADGAASAAEIRSGKWGVLEEGIEDYNPGSRVSVALAAATVHRAQDPEARERMLSEYAQASAPENWSGFFPGRKYGKPDLLRAWVTVRPESVSDARFAGLVHDAIASPEIDLSSAIAILGAARTSGTVAPPLDRFVDGDKRLRRLNSWIANAPDGEFTGDVQAELSAISEPVLRIRRRDLLYELLRRPEYDAILDVLASLPRGVAEGVGPFIESELAEARTQDIEYFLRLWDEADRRRSPVEPSIREALVDWYIDADRRGVLEQFKKRMRPDALELFDQIAKTARRERRSGKRAIKDVKNFFGRRKT